jgi:hypothetical protein
LVDLEVYAEFLEHVVVGDVFFLVEVTVTE